MLEESLFVKRATESGGESKGREKSRRKMAINKSVFDSKHFLLISFQKERWANKRRSLIAYLSVSYFQPKIMMRRFKASPRFCECSVKSISMSVSNPKFLLDWKPVICSTAKTGITFTSNSLGKVSIISQSYHAIFLSNWFNQHELKEFSS